MIQNIKVDIVYFMAATDFEFEFNLGSCCHMRLLNDKTKDKKSFVNSLARAVSRSQIILCVGPLFGEDGLIATAAAAINHPLEKADNKAYGIAAEEAVDIIAGSVPLVTPEGYFGGCIIESGKQSIILLSENRTIRKSIMKTLVHPYIEDISVMQSTKQVTVNKADSEIPEEAAPAVLQEETNSETEPEIEPVIEPVIEPEVETPEEPEAETPQPETQIIAEAEPEKVNPQVNEEPETEEKEETHNIFFDFSDNEQAGDKEGKPEEAVKEIEADEEKIMEDAFIQDDDYENQEKPSKGINISILIISFVLTLAVLALCYFLIYLPMQKGISTVEYFKQIFSTVSETGSV